MTWLLIWAGVKSRLSAAFGWMRANPSLAVIIALSVALAWTWHGKAKAERRIAGIEAVRKADAVTWATTDRLNHHTIDGLIDTLNNQSRMIRAWGNAAKVQQDAAQAALKAATTRGAHMEALAHVIDLDGAQGASWPACKSGKAVMAAKGDL